MSVTAPLFEPFTLGTMTIPNRIVMAPMTRNFSPNGVPTDEVRDYYRRRAESHVGLIVSEGTTVARGGASNDPRIPNFHKPDALAGWEKVIAAVHGVGGKMGPQLWHQGMLRKPGTGPEPEAASDGPSGLTHRGKAVQEPPSEEEVWDMVMAYANAAGEAKRLGFDCLELHGAHGYLIDEFFWGVMNVREDRFGGDLPERATFAAEIIKQCRLQVGPDMPIILRFSQWKTQDFHTKLAETPQELEAFLRVFVDAGVDCLHCSQRRFWEAEFEAVDGIDGLNLAGWTKKLTGLPTITVGSVGLSTEFIGAFRGEGSKTRPLTDVIERLDKGEFDMVGVGRALLQDPFWAQKIHDGHISALSDYDAAALNTLY